MPMGNAFVPVTNVMAERNAEMGVTNGIPGHVEPNVKM